jgi:hypothetical protein
MVAIVSEADATIIQQIPITMVSLIKCSSLQLSKSQLIHETQSQSRMLKHVIKAEILDRIILRMDLLVRIRKSRFDDKGRRISCL